MAWIESHQTLREHPKTKRAARLLRISRVQVIGHLHCLWWWALDYAQDGNITAYSPDDIADAADWVGDPDEFLNALIKAGGGERPGFIERNGDGLALHDWWEYAGKLVGRRISNAARQKNFRDKTRRPIYERDGGCCRYCGRPISADEFVVDHIIPARRGGPSTSDNFATACPSCNTRKNNRTPEEAGMTLLPLVNAPRNSYVTEIEPRSNGATNQPTEPTEPTEPTQPTQPTQNCEKTATGCIRNLETRQRILQACERLRIALGLKGAILPNTDLLAIKDSLEAFCTGMLSFGYCRPTMGKCGPYIEKRLIRLINDAARGATTIRAPAAWCSYLCEMLDNLHDDVDTHNTIGRAVKEARVI